MNLLSKTKYNKETAEIQKLYPEYKLADTKDFIYREPKTPYEEKICKKTKVKNILWVLLFLIITVLIELSFYIFTDLEFPWSQIVYGLGTLLVIACFYSLFTIIRKKIVVFEAKLVHKYVRVSSSVDDNSESYSYYAFVAIDHPYKLISNPISINANTYNDCAIGTQVLVIKTGNVISIEPAAR